jgi:hypothetical protein
LDNLTADLANENATYQQFSATASKIEADRQQVQQ